MRFIVALFLLVMLSACQRPALYQQESYVFGTRVVISIWDSNEKQANQATSEALAELDRLHAKLHAWRPSEITRLNQSFSQGKSASLDPELSGMLQQAADYARRSDQLFNPAVGQLVAVWGFQRDTFEPVTPDPKAIQALLQAHPSLEDLDITPASVSSRNRAVAIDLGGFAKGWALDRVANILRQHGIKNALINIGGNVLAMGSKDGKKWTVGLQHPRKPLAIATLSLDDGESIGTSGDYQRFFEKDGKRFAHIIDPRTGWPASQLEAATVIAPAGKQAGLLSDVATKPLFIGGSKTALKYAKQFEIHDILLIDPEGTALISPSMQKRIVWLEKPGRIVTLE